MRRKRTERIVRKGDPDHREYCMIGTHYKPYGDILVVGTMKQIHFNYGDYAKRHHGGYLGTKSREQSKIENK